ncbi:hypothetical protein MES4922_110054 [Mesorhizobium ventifaucium]|uniref:Uncharacterized protein n=1 Tax=Mesorhizobium ventifaucium TaxID=666020 RepID=A0ABM9DEN2_9HYPH|nr:hypothetical protein MES4922_110054 [Mesorhizobium ventifaucium]
MVAHGHHSSVKPAHDLSYFANRLFGVRDLDIPRHAVADFHGNLPSFAKPLRDTVFDDR